MAENIREKCGVIAVSSASKENSPEIFLNLLDGLLALQHRGQESAGISIVSNGKIKTKKGMGLVSHVFSHSDISSLSGFSGIGHTRYSTTGSSSIENAQPLVVKNRKLEIAVAFNGNIVNYDELKAEISSSLKPKISFCCSSDTELIGKLFISELEKESKISSETYFSAMRSLMGKLEGSYSLLILLSDGTIMAARDPRGFKPLCMGKKKTLLSELAFVASETAALDSLGAQYDREILPGEAVLIKGGKIESQILKTEENHSHCMFEYVYFSRPDSVIEGKPVYEARENLGRELAKLFNHSADIVIPIPDSGRSAAYGFSKASGIPLTEGLIKNRYIFRTFIMPSDSQRKSSISLKLNPIRAAVAGKRVALVDDSIIRGNTMRKIVKSLRDAGATEVHLLISCPPVIAPCYMGIDFPTYKELIASGKSIEQINRELGADSVTYMNVEGLVRSIGLPNTDLCLACLTDVYPTKKISDFAKQKKLSSEKKRFTIAVLASGRGSNLQSIISNIESKNLDVNLVAVISDKPDAFALKRAEKHSVDNFHVDPKSFSSKEEYESAILKILRDRNVDLVVLAGYMRIVGKVLLSAYPNKIINIHPTLLPKFQGCISMQCHEQVLAAKETESGCTVHLVTEEVDGGKILAQKKVKVLPKDTPKSLASRVLKEEHKLLPSVIRMFSEGKSFQ